MKKNKMNFDNKLKFSNLRNYKSFFFVLFFVALLFLFLQFSSQKGNEIEEGLKPYPFLSPAVIVSDRTDALVNFQPLRDSLQEKYEWAEGGDFIVSLYFEYLPTGANIAVNKEERIWPASLIKIPVAMAAMKKVEKGTWSLSNELVIMDEDKDSLYGDLYKEPTGTTLSIKDFFHKTLRDSDNTAHFVLLRNLEGSELEDVFLHLGLDEVLDVLKRTPQGEEPDNRITTKNYSVFFRSLYNATYLSPTYSELFLEFLVEAPKDHLGSGIPSDITFAHKTGVRVENMVWADSGIAYVPRRPFLLTVMIQQKKNADPDHEGAKKIFKDIAQEVYTYVAESN